nr:DUF2812 domain-containing protein [Eubacterium sp.]
MKKKLVRRMHFINMYELRAIEEYLEEMALRGLMFVKARGVFFYFRQCEPRKVKFCVDIFGKTSVFKKEQGQTVNDYIEYCEAAGWHHLSTRDKWHFFYTEDLSCVPIHTDSKLQLKMLNHQVLKENVLIWGVYGYMFFILLRDSFTCETWVDRLIRVESVGVTLSMVLFFFVLDAICYIVFYIKNYQRVKRNQELCFSKKETVDCIFKVRTGIATLGMINYMVVMVSMFDAMAAGVIIACLLPVMIVWIWNGINRKKIAWGRRKTNLVFCLIVVFCLICSNFLVVKAVVSFSEKDDTKIPYELTDVPMETVHDEKDKQVEASIFGNYTSYSHCCYDEKMELVGDLSYEVLRTPLPFIRKDYVKYEVAMESLETTDISRQECELWGAKKVYLRQDKEDKRYVGRMVEYEDCVLIISSNQLAFGAQEIKEIRDNVLKRET